LILATLLVIQALAAEEITAQDRNCRDFRTWAEAQAFFQSAGPGDPHHLDADGDGIACESLPGAPGSQEATRPAATRTSVAEPRATSTPRPTLDTPRPTRTPSQNTRSPRTRTPTSTALPSPSAELLDRSEVAPPSGELDSQVAPEPTAVATREVTLVSQIWARVLDTVDVLSPTGEILATAEPGALYLVCGNGDGWIAIALDGDCAAPGRIEAGPGVQFLREEASR
jgi:hypothetical protein